MTEKSIHIRATATTVYRLIADPIRMAEWSPECVHCRWTAGSETAQVGARFRGTSRNGRRRWTTSSTITHMRPAELFAWEVTYFGQPVARWEYRIEPTDDGVRLIEAVEDRRGRALRAVSPLITGSPDRDRRNADTMETTLEAVKAAAEAQDR
jgi:uncharacterized protein YndB with AHSA1/START domain